MFRNNSLNIPLREYSHTGAVLLQLSPQMDFVRPVSYELLFIHKTRGDQVVTTWRDRPEIERQLTKQAARTTNET